MDQSDNYIHPEIIALRQAFRGIEAISEVFRKQGIPVVATSYRVEPDQEDQSHTGWSLHHNVVLVKNRIDVSYNVYREHQGIGYQVLFDVRSELLNPSTKEPGTNVIFFLEYVITSEDRKTGGHLRITESDSTVGYAFLRDALGVSRRDFERITSPGSSDLDESAFLIFLEVLVQRLAPIITCNQAPPQSKE